MISDVTLQSGNLAEVGLDVLRRRWGWILGLGVVLIISGIAALSSAFLMTIFSVKVLGVLMCTSGILEAIYAFSCKQWGGFFVNLLTGLLYVVVGFMLVGNPAESAVALTLLVSLLLIFGGIFRIAVALVVRFPNWPWLLLHGVIILLLGLSIWRGWPLTGLWVIGLFAGIDMLFNGLSLVMLGLAVRKLPSPSVVE